MSSGKFEKLFLLVSRLFKCASILHAQRVISALASVKGANCAKIRGCKSFWTKFQYGPGVFLASYNGANNRTKSW